METLYTIADGNGEFPLHHLGYRAGSDDKIVFAVHSKLNMFTRDEGPSLQIWGWDANALRDEDRYRIEQLIRSYLYQEDRILDALRRLDGDLVTLRESSKDAAEAIDTFLRSIRDRITAQLDAEYEAEQAETKERAEADAAKYGISVEAAMSMQYGNEPMRMGPDPRLVRDAAGRSKSIIDFTDPEIAHSLGSVASLEKGGRGAGADIWRLKDNGYGPDRIPHDALRALVDLVLAVQAEYQLQSLLLDREFERFINTRGREYEYLKAQAAAEAAKSSVTPSASSPPWQVCWL